MGMWQGLAESTGKLPGLAINLAQMQQQGQHMRALEQESSQRTALARDTFALAKTKAQIDNDTALITQNKMRAEAKDIEYQNFELDLEDTLTSFGLTPRAKEIAKSKMSLYLKDGTAKNPDGTPRKVFARKHGLKVLDEISKDKETSLQIDEATLQDYQDMITQLDANTPADAEPDDKKVVKIKKQRMQLQAKRDQLQNHVNAQRKTMDKVETDVKILYTVTGDPIDIDMKDPEAVKKIGELGLMDATTFIAKTKEPTSQKRPLHKLVNGQWMKKETIGDAEYEAAVQDGWKSEGPQFAPPKPDTTNVKLYKGSGRDIVERTAKETEVAELLKSGWVQDRPLFAPPQPGEVTLYKGKGRDIIERKIKESEVAAAKKDGWSDARPLFAPSMSNDKPEYTPKQALSRISTIDSTIARMKSSGTVDTTMAIQNPMLAMLVDTKDPEAVNQAIASLESERAYVAQYAPKGTVKERTSSVVAPEGDKFTPPEGAETGTYKGKRAYKLDGKFYDIKTGKEIK